MGHVVDSGWGLPSSHRRLTNRHHAERAGGANATARRGRAVLMSGGVGLGGLGYCRALGQGARAWHRVWSDAAHGGSQHKVCRGSGRSLRKCERDCVMHRTRNCASLGCTSRPLRRAVMHTHIHAWAEAYPGELQTRICTARECCLPGGRWAHEAATQRVAALPEELTSMRGRAATIRRYILVCTHVHAAAAAEEEETTTPGLRAAFTPYISCPPHSFRRRSQQAQELRECTTALPSHSKPAVMAPQREEHVGRPSTPRQRCAAPRVRPNRFCSAS